MKSILLIALGVIGIQLSAYAQFPGCPSVDAGPDTTTDCSQPCIDLVATPFDAGATTSYSVSSIPHTPPIAYNAGGGTAVSVGVDDIWSSAITLPFDFCFYGQTYNSCIIGSNGCVQFDVSDAGGFHPWSYSATCPSAALVDAGNIFGPYHDIDPSVSGTVNYYILGTAPCRIFVVSFNAIAHFSCTSLTSTHMIVLYETTNAIDVYIQNKATCSSWNSGNTVVGIQDDTGAQGIAAPGRNTGAWTVTTPEGWRFMPAGAPIYTVEWFEGGNSVGTGDTLNVCPISTTTYTAQATYTSCNGTVIVETDDVTVTPLNGGLTITELANVPSDCNASTGQIEIEATGGVGTINYSFEDTLNFQTSGAFDSLAPGSYTIYVQDGSGCISGYSFVIDEQAGPSLTFNNATNTTCGQVNGTIDVSAVNGTQPYDFTLNGGSSQPTGAFTGVDANTYLVQVEDQNGCTDTLTVVISAEPYPILSEVSTDTICSGGGDASIEVSASNGVPPYMYSVDGGASQSSGVFTNLSDGVHQVVVSDSNSCLDTISVEVFAFPDPVIFASTDACDLIYNVTGTSTPNGGYWSAADTTINFFPDSLTLNPSITAGDIGVYTVSFTDSVCNTTVSSQINFLPPPWVFLQDTTVCMGTSYQLVAVAEPSSFSYIWSDGTTGTTSIYVTEPGIYSVEAENACGVAIDEALIGFKLCDITVPNILSMSSEVGNDLWFVEADGLETFNCRIVNRWGNLIYEFNDVNGGWDGTSNGKPVSEGTYFYIIDATIEGGDPLQKHGFIEVVE